MLRRIRREQLQVVEIAERDERVASTAAGMAAAAHRLHAATFLEPYDRCIQVGGADKDVIENLCGIEKLCCVAHCNAGVRVQELGT